MRILYRYNNYTLNMVTGEKYYCVPFDNNVFITLGVRYLGNINDISTTGGIYSPTTSYSSVK